MIGSWKGRIDDPKRFEKTYDGPGAQFGLSDQTMLVIDEIFRAQPHVKGALVYGSRAKGTYRPGSDIDIALFTTKDFTHGDLQHVLRDFDDSILPYFVDVCDYAQIEQGNLKDHIDRVGKVLWQAD
jgi:predicted nucleotidyltransferase